MNISGRMSNHLASVMASAEDCHEGAKSSDGHAPHNCTRNGCPNPAVRSVSSPSNNPYSTFTFCCAILNTKEHAQLIGVVSFSLFICLVVISLLMFHFLAVFYIVLGAVVYGMLMKVLFSGYHDKVYVLCYLLFEALQIGFYLALFLCILMPLLFGQMLPDADEQSRVSRAVLGEMTVIVLLLMSIKMYFAHVITKFYKYLVWEEKTGFPSSGQIRAQYFNRREVRISVGDHFPQPPTSWDAEGGALGLVGNYGYSIHQNGTSQQFPELPSYLQVMGTDKVQAQPSNPATSSTTQSPPSQQGTSEVPSANLMREVDMTRDGVKTT